MPAMVGYLNHWATAALGTAGTPVGSLVIRASDSRPEGLGDSAKYPSTHTEYVLVKSVGPKVLWAESRVQETGEYFPLLQFHAKIVEVEIGSVAIYRPFGEFRRAHSYCHLYGEQYLGQRQAYFQPLATMNLWASF
ncbi:uncharacterized protein TNCV_4991451 [Trichonephila clavipes]|nr:uncharacterized protein TNCV_4991451 [Trichonephila clavipes]